MNWSNDNINELHERLSKLHYALYYDRIFQKVLTVGERILINQERGSIMSIISFINYETPENEVKYFEVKSVINKKVNYLKNKFIRIQ